MKQAGGVLIDEASNWKKPPEPPPLSRDGAIALRAWKFCGPHIDRLPAWAAINRVHDFELTLDLWAELSAIESEE